MDQREPARAIWRALAIALTLGIVVSGFGYAIFRRMTPVSTEEAVERFRAENDGGVARRHEVDQHEKRTKRFGTNNLTTRRSGRSEVRLSSSPSQMMSSGSGSITQHSSSTFDVMPAEGVYEYVGTGHEGFNGINRDFPSEVTTRTITHGDRDTWLEHHIFSSERASWTRITTGANGRLVHSQRNLIAIGPIRRDTNVPFNPPIEGVRFPYREGETWSGEFNGRTEPDGEDYSGTYRIHAVGEERRTIDDKGVKVLGYRLDVDFDGELEATVTVAYWIAPRYGLTVQEDYSIDAKVQGLSYHGEWDVKLRSLTPRT